MTVTSFVRTRLTWLLYALLAYYAFLQISFGPVMPFLRDELQLNFTLGGLHGTAFAVGMVIAGVLGDWFIERFGTHLALWFGGLGLALGTALFTLGAHAVMTISAAVIMGATGTLLLILVQALLSDAHGAMRATALAEANVMAALSASLAPMLIGGAQSLGLGWRAALWVVIAYGVMLVLVMQRQPLPQVQVASVTDDNAQKKLPLRFWIFWIVLFLGVSVEWATAFWAADFLRASVQLSAEVAAISVTAFTGAGFLARLITSRLTRRYPTTYLLLGSLLLTLIGLPLFWLLRVPVLNVMGLFLVGAGIMNVFPLGLALAMDSAPTLSNRASARLSLAAAMAILVAPQLLGTIADVIGVAQAYGLVLLIAVTAFVTVWWVVRVNGRSKT